MTSDGTDYGGLPVEKVSLPPVPSIVVRAGLGSAWNERAGARLLARRALEHVLDGGVQVLHAQHMVSTLAVARASQSARRRGARVVTVATVRDYWPLCPVSTRLIMKRDGHVTECRECHMLPRYLKCATAGKSPFSYPVALARWLRAAKSASALASCDAVIGVSDYVRGELARSGRVPAGRLVAIPNMVDLASVDRALAGEWPLPDIGPDEAFLLFVGKWDYNKGAQMLPGAVARSGVRMPVVLAGEGPMRSRIEEEARGFGLDFHFYKWLDNDAVILLMRRAKALLFPSAWQEPLSRVLLEGCAAGAAIVALDTGGTPDIIEHRQSGWLANDMSRFIEGIRQVSSDLKLNGILREGARARAEGRFSSERVSARVEQLYRKLLEAR